MKSAFRRIISLVFCFVILVSSLSLTAFGEGVTFNQIVNAATYVIVNNEGSYTTVVKNDVNAVSIGKLGWHATNALNLLKDIAAENPTQAQSILGTALYNEIITSSSWEGRVATSAEANVISVLLATSESKKVQDATAFEYIAGYVRHGQSLGLSEPRALVFLADYENQNGRYGAYSFYNQVMRRWGTVTLSTLYRTSSQNSRRTRTYNFCLNVNFADYTNGFTPDSDTDAPKITDVIVSNLDETGYTVSCKASDNRAVTEIYFAIYYKNDGADSAKWYQVTPNENGVSHRVSISEFSSRSGDYCTYIYAFDKAGNYSYVGLNVITVPKKEEIVPALTLTVTQTGSLKLGEKARWHASAANGSGNYLYSFALSCDGRPVGERRPSDYGDFEKDLSIPGIYQLVVTVEDTVTKKVDVVTVRDIDVFNPIEIASCEAESESVMIGDNISWTVKASGGRGNLEYSYTYYKDGELAGSRDFNSNATGTYHPAQGGVYSVLVTVRDEYNHTASYRSESKIVVNEKLNVDNAAFTETYAVKNAVVTLSADIKGGVGEKNAVFEIFCDGESVIKSDPVASDSFIFIVPKGGNYTAAITVTDSDNTSVTVNCDGLYADEAAKRCDANCDGKITAADARFALRCSAKLDIPPENLKYAVDANLDGNITASDARFILRVSAGLEKIE